MFYSDEAIAFYLLVLASVFKFLAFVYNDNVLGKDKLKKAIQILKTQKIFALEKKYFAKITERIKSSTAGNKLLWYFLLPMFFLNILIIPASCLFVESIKNGSLAKGWVKLAQYKMYNAELWRTILLHFCAGAIGTLLNLSSFSITKILLRKMASAKTQGVILFQLLLNFIIVGCYSFFLVPTSILFNWKLADDKHTWLSFNSAWHGTYHDKQDILIPILYGGTSSIPTVLYFLTGLLLLLFKLTPPFLKKFLVDILNALNRNDRNVFSDIGTFLAGLGALVGGAKFIFH